MRSGTADRAAALVSGILLGALGLFTYYLAEVAERPLRGSPASGSFEPEYFVQGLALTRITETGEAAFRLEAASLRHEPRSDTAEFGRPRLMSLDPASPRLVIVAERGTVRREGEEAVLSGGVVLTRAASDKTAALRAETEEVTVLHDAQIIRTDRSVRIEQGASRITGTGMELDHQARRMRLDSEVRVVWHAGPVSGPAPRSAPRSASGPVKP